MHLNACNILDQVLNLVPELSKHFTAILRGLVVKRLDRGGREGLFWGVILGIWKCIFWLLQWVLIKCILTWFSFVFDIARWYHCLMWKCIGLMRIIWSGSCIFPLFQKNKEWRKEKYKITQLSFKPRIPACSKRFFGSSFTPPLDCLFPNFTHIQDVSKWMVFSIL